MRTNAILSITIGSLILAGVVVAGLLVVVRNRDRDAATSSSQVDSRLTADDKTLQNFANLQTVTPKDDRIVLFGGSLAVPAGSSLADQLRLQLGREVEVVDQQLRTTIQSMDALRNVLRKPPAILILDIGRYDASNGFTMDATATNMSLIAQKASELSVQTVVITGLGSDGNTAFGSVIESSVQNLATVVDATPMLLDDSLRISTTELNDEGKRRLINQLVAAVKANDATP